MSQILTPRMIIENTQLGKVVSLLKGLERHFYAEDGKSISVFTKLGAPGFYTEFTQKMIMKFTFLGKKSIFHLLRKSRVLTLLGAKQPYQVACFHLSLSG